MFNTQGNLLEYLNKEGLRFRYSNTSFSMVIKRKKLVSNYFQYIIKYNYSEQWGHCIHSGIMFKQTWFPITIVSAYYLL